MTSFPPFVPVRRGFFGDFHLHLSQAVRVYDVPPALLRKEKSHESH